MSPFSIYIDYLFYLLFVKLAPFKYQLKDLDFLKALDDAQAHASEVVKQRQKEVTQSITNNYKLQVENNEFTHCQQINIDSFQNIYPINPPQILVFILIFFNSPSKQQQELMDSIMVFFNTTFF